MKLKVFHKGLIIVLTPLSIELLLIGSLAFLVMLTDRQQTQGAVDRQLAILSARLLFSNMHAVNSLNGAMYDEKKFDHYNLQTLRTSSYLNVLSSLQPELGQDSLLLSEQLIEAERFVLSTLDKIAEITRQGLSLPNLYRLQSVEDRACRRLSEAQQLVSQFYESVNGAARDGQIYLSNVYRLSAAVVLLGVGLNLAAALVLAGYFRRNFLSPLAVVRDNVSRIEQRTHLNNPLSGADEICDLDRSFHAMNYQLILASEREQALFDNSSDIICVLNEQMRIARINQAIQTTLGFSVEELSGEPIAAILTGEGLKRAIEELERARLTGIAASFESDSLTRRQLDKSLLWSAIWTPSQKCWYCVLHDISAQKALENAQRNLVRLIVSEFEQPLLRMSIQIESISQGGLGELSDALRVRVSGAASTVLRLVKLVGDLLQIEHLQSTDLALEHSLCGLSKIFEESCRDVESAAQLKRISILRQGDDCQLQADQHKLTRVLVNLLSNAIKFSPEGSTVELIGKREGAMVLIQVVDQGRGVPAEKLSALFQPFQQVEREDGRRGSGSGLGLVICKRIVEQHGGAVGVDSQLERGSTFWLRLPIAKSVPLQSRSEGLDARSQLAASVPEPPPEPNERARKETRVSFGANWSMRKKGLLLIGVPLAFELPFIALMLGLLMQGEGDVRRQIHDRELTAPAMKLVLNLAAVAYAVSYISRDPGAIQRCEQHLPMVSEAAQDFCRVAGRDAPAASVAQAALPAIKPLVGGVRRVIGLSEQGRLTIKECWASAGEILDLSDKMAQKVERLLTLLEKRHRDALSRQARMRSELSMILLSGLVINCATALGLAAIFSWDVVRRLKTLSGNSRKFAEHKPVSPPQAGTDEIAQLDQDFHATALRIVEQRTRERAFLDNARNVICSLSQTGQLVAYNPATIQLFGLAGGQPFSWTLFDILEEPEASAARRGLEQARTTGQPSQLETGVFVDGRRIDLLWSVSWSPTEKTYFCVAHDVTTRKNLERLKREFIAVITHDLRSPITSISGMSLLAVNGVYGALSDRLRPAFLAINQESERIVDLVNDILDLEKLESGKLELQLEATDAACLFTEALSRLRQETELVNITGVSAKLQLNVDVERLSQALSGVLRELLACQPKEIEVKCFAGDSICFGLLAHQCKVDGNMLNSFVARTAKLNAETEEPASSRMRWLVALKVIEAHCGQVKTACEEREITVEIVLPR
jgi:PAS domain S-box-containing protein